MDDELFLDRFFHSLVGKIFIAATQTFLVSQALLLIFAARQMIDIQVLKYAIVAAVGLTAGFSARRFLKGHTLILKLLAALFSAALSLAVQGSLSGGFIGILPFPANSRYPDWDSLVQLGTAALAAALVVFSFRTRPQAIPAQPAPDQPGVSSSRSARKSAAPKISRVAVQGAEPLPAPRIPARQVSRGTRPDLAVKKPARTKAKKRSALEIKFIGEEEHFCPYCLERVEEHDPRGVKICPICKTWHHADCWGITGACQIPHAHEK